MHKDEIVSAPRHRGILERFPDAVSPLLLPDVHDVVWCVMGRRTEKQAVDQIAVAPRLAGGVNLGARSAFWVRVWGEGGIA